MKPNAYTANLLRNFVPILLGTICLLASDVHSQDLNSWVSRYPLPQGNKLLSIAAVKNRFVAVGERGTILTSRDGLSWTNRDSHTSQTLNAVCYGPERFEAGGDFGTLLTSPLGTTWTTRPASTASFTALASCSDIPAPFQIVAMAYSKYFTSTDGVAWNGPFTDPALNSGMYAMAYGNGLFVATGNGGQIATMDITTATGPSGTWTVQSSPAPYLMYSVCYGNGLFVIAGQEYVLTSANGTNWSIAYTVQTPNTALKSVTFGANTYVAVGFGVIATSQNGQTWTETPLPGASLYGVAYGSGRFVAVGDFGLMLQSTDGLHWSQISSQLIPTWTGAAYGTGKLVAVGAGKSIALSPDGSTAFGQLTVSNVNKTIHANGKFLCVGANGGIATSTDGLNWNSVSSGTTNSINDILYTNNQFVAIGDAGTALTSTDGVTWSAQPIGTPNRLMTLSYANGAYNAVGSNGTLRRSTDASNWVSIPFTGTTNAIYANGIWVEVQYTGVTVGFVNGTILSSTNGQLWVTRTKIQGGSPAVAPLSFANGRFIAITGTGYGTSTNGIDWQTNSFSTGHPITALAVADDKVAAVGLGGTVLESESLPALQPAQLSEPKFIDAHTFQMSFTAEQDDRYRLQTSSTLQTWVDTDLSNPEIFGQGTYPVVITDTNAASPNQSYRAVLYP